MTKVIFNSDKLVLILKNQMKAILSIILSTIIFTASFQNALFMIDYQINRKFYEIHCINKSKPEMDCHGKCQMKKESEKASNPFSLVKYSFEFNILPSEPAAFSLKPHGSLDFDSSAYSYYAQNISEVFLDNVPNPPQI